MGFNGLSNYFGIQKDVHSGFVLRFVARPREHVVVAVCVTLTLSLSFCVCVLVCVCVHVSELHGLNEGIGANDLKRS